MTARIERRAFAYRFVAVLAVVGAFCLPRMSPGQQQASPRRIGFLLVALSPESKQVKEFRQALREAGYSEGRDVVIEWRTADGDPNRLTKLVEDLVTRKVDVIVVTSTPAAQAASHVTSITPIVMALVGDPVGSGLVTNLRHPGGNVTGFSVMAAELSAKRLQLLKETIPRLTHVTVLWHPPTPWHAEAIEDIKAAAASLSIELTFVPVRRPEEFSTVIATASRAHAQALYLLENPLFFSHPKALADLAAKAHLPAIYGERVFADEGGLMSYGATYGDLFRRSAEYVVKILGGTKPGDLPIEQPTKFELVVNLRTAKSIGIAIPQSVLVQANEVIR